MQIVHARTEVVRWQIAGDGAARGRTERAAVLLEVMTDTGHIGLGEAAPLDGFGDDSLDAAHASLESFCSRLPFVVPATHENLLGGMVFMPSRSAWFAVHTALLDACARAEGVPFASFLAARGTNAARLASQSSVIECAVVVDSPAAARRATLDGARTLKIKAGPQGDVERILAIHRAAPDAMLRIDPNRSWPADRALTYLRALADLPIEYVEEPCLDTIALLEHALPVPLALDETLGRALDPDDMVSILHADVARAAMSPQVAALVLKPTVIGSLSLVTAIARFGADHGKRIVVTHALEGPIGTAACAAFAQSLAEPGVAAGLAPHPGLAHWPVTIPYLSATKLHPNLEPGLGLERERPLATRLDEPPRIADMAAHLARENERAVVDNDLAVITPARSLRFDELTVTESARVLARAFGDGAAGLRPLFAISSFETVRLVHAALTSYTPIALLNPKLATDEIARQQRLVAESWVPDDTAAVLFTSGSTGQARGVALSRAALDAAADTANSQLGLRAGDRWLLALPIAHAGGLSIIVRCRAARIPVVVLEGDFDRASCAALLEQCTLASLVPTQLAALLDDPAWRPAARLRAVLLGGAAAAPALLERAAARGVPFLTSYGLTESFGQIATAPLGHAGDPRAPLSPLRGVDVSAGTRISPAAIVVQAPTLATQYLDGAPIAPAFTTADLGFVEDGALHVVGRADDVIITGGENVHPLEVEAVLAATSGVRAVVVFGAPDQRWGELVCAAMVVESGFDRARAAASWRQRLPRHALPREIALVDALPLLPNGKVDRRAASMLPRDRQSYEER